MGNVGLKGLADLEDLAIKGLKVDLAGFMQIKNPEKLKSLLLTYSQLSGGLEHLSGFSRLEILWLDHTKITGQQLKGLGRLENLKELWLTSAAIGDEDLLSLRHLRRLAFLDLRDTGVTNNGVKDLEAALPNCSVAGVGKER